MKQDTSETAMSRDELRAIQSLRVKGWGVILWEPDELDGVDPEIVEDALIERGWDVIFMHGGRGLTE
jgi:hypothetical protein